MSYIAPSFRAKAFTCPYCEVNAQMNWSDLTDEQGFEVPMFRCTCQVCKNNSYWFANSFSYNHQSRRYHASDVNMALPSASTAPIAHNDLPEDALVDYNEARTVLQYSPKSAGALLRLALQKLCIHLGGKGKNLNEDIGDLVKKGLPVQVQKTLDIVRVVGNSAIHPGELNESDILNQVMPLFELINIIVQRMITDPKEIDNLYESLVPDSAKESIEKRDS